MTNEVYRALVQGLPYEEGVKEAYKHTAFKG